MHSGTTLLGHVTGNLTSTLCLSGETKFLEFSHRYRALYPDLSNPRQREEFRNLCAVLLSEGFDFGSLAGSGPGFSGERSDIGEYVHEFVSVADDYLAENGASILVEHSGTNVFSYRELAGLDGAYLVEVVRDPRDVLASKKIRRLTVFSDRYSPDQQRRKHFEKSFDPVWDTISWRSFARAGMHAEASMPGRYLRIRYEDLVADPGRELDRIADLLGSTRLTGAPKVAVNNAADPNRVRSGIDSSSVGQWQEVLSPGEAATVEWLARTEMRVLSLGSAAPRLRLAMVAPAARALKEPVVRVYRRARLGGIHGARALVRNYFRRLGRGSSL